jgi:glutathione S-transferase
MNPIKLYHFPLSGHAHRVQLMLSLLELPVEIIFVDLAKGAHKQPEFLAINAFGQVPVLDDNGVVLADSNAILVYLASKYGHGRWLPTDPVGAARVQRWLSVAAGPLHAGPATARLITVFGASHNAEDVIARSHNLLKVIDQELSNSTYLAGDAPTIADIAGYTYIAHAPEGNVSLQDAVGLQKDA